MAEEKNKQRMNKVFALLTILTKDKRYDPEAYSFIMASMDYTMKKLKRKGHVTGQELSDGIKDYCLEQFGPLARPVLEKWGIKSTNDFGEIVFNLIDSGLLGKTERDRREDFHDRYNFKEAFDKGCKYSLH
ncbi:MAG: hypothetical protein COS29_02480 [Candidatus Omnitrophica bacterium CG02_land_8_20_14_3_00__42_8]|nr:MAG: hypothetical protein COS29_02480 [Candidatus Omnitrophica bacterium CG02_land_8_20_14_3_00__42_8]PIW67216.1 MAG: hypothetical protein COW10_06895 [Candidatus Omnitrophica bacterium CG12_big_fil_rev_8_21_14_0_65_42_8]